MKQVDRAPYDRALHRARVAAYAPAEFVGQESFMTAREIRALAVQAGIGPGVTVLDLCCGIAGPGRFLTRELRCTYLGVDASASAVAIARERAGDLPCRFAIGWIPPLPAGPFDVVLLLETMLAFEDKDALLREITAALRPGGRFAFTLEEGPPLTAAARGGVAGAHPPLPAAHGGRAGGDARRRHRLAHPARRDGRVPGAGRARRHVAGGPQPRAPRDGAGAGGRVRRGRRGHRCADRSPGSGRPARRAPAVDRMAGPGTRAEVRAGRGAAPGRPGWRDPHSSSEHCGGCGVGGVVGQSGRTVLGGGVTPVTR